MQAKANYWSFIFTIICIILCLMALAGWFGNSIMGIHPLTIILIITLLTFLIGVYGFSGVKDWKGIYRSIFTVVLTLILSSLLGFVIFFGSLLS